MKLLYPALLIAGASVLFSDVNARAEMRAESVGYNFTKHFGIETAVECIETRVDDTTRTGLTEGQSGSPMERVNLIFYHIDAVYHFMPDTKFTPFVSAGLGGAHYSPKISTGGTAAFNVGAGVEYAMTDTIGLWVDVRDYMATEAMQDTSHTVGGMAGITFAFDDHEKSASAVQEKFVPSPVEPRGIAIAFDDIHFDFDRAARKPEAKKILRKNLRILKENP